MAGNVKDLTDSTFAMTTGEGVTLVDFWAPWCPPCRAQGPIVEKLADSFDGRAVVAKVNIDDEPATASKFGVASIPTLLILKDGKEMKRFVGLMQETDLTEQLEAFV